MHVTTHSYSILDAGVAWKNVQLTRELKKIKKINQESLEDCVAIYLFR